MADRYLLETSSTDGYQLEDGSGVLLLEIPRVDSWNDPSPRPILPPARPFFSQARTITFTEIQTALDQGWNLSDASVVRRNAIGVRPDAIIDPAALLTAPPETITSDKWTSDSARVVQPPARPFFSQARTITFTEIAEAEETVTLDMFNQPYTPRWPATRPVITAARTVALAEDLPIDWWQAFEHPILPKNARMRSRSTEYLLPIAAASETVTLDKWKESDWWKVRTVQRQRPQFEIDSQQLTLAEAISMDKWLAPLAEIRRLKRRGDASYIYQLPIEGVAEILTLDKWNANQTVRRERENRQRPEYAIDANQLTQAERTTIDKWLSEVPRTFRERIRIKGSAAGPLVQPELITFDKWNTDSGRRVLAKLRQRPEFTIDSRHLLDLEGITVDKWITALHNQPFRAIIGRYMAASAGTGPLIDFPREVRMVIARMILSARLNASDIDIYGTIDADIDLLDDL